MIHKLEKLALSAVLVAGLVSITSAKETELKTKTEIGYMNSTGNSEVSTGSVLFDAEKIIDKHTIKTHYEWYYSEEDGIENKNKMMAKLNYLYEVSKKFSFDYIVQGEKDKKSGFDYKIFTGPGVHYKVIDEKENPHKLSIGANIVVERDKPDYLDAETYTAFLANEQYSWDFSKNIKFTQDLSYRTDVSDTDIFNVTANFGLENKMNKYFSLGLNYKIDYTNTVLPGIENTDKIFTASLIFTY